MTGKSGRHVRGRWWRRLFKVGFFAVGLLLLGALVAPKFVARYAVQLALTSAEQEPFDFAIETANWRSLTLAGVAIGSGPDFAADKIEVSFKIGDLLRGKIERVVLSRPRLRGAMPSADERIQGPALSFGVLDRFIFGRDDEAAGVAVDVQRLVVDDGLITLASPEMVVLTSTIDAVFTPDDRSELSFTAAGGPKAPGLSATGRLAMTQEGVESGKLKLNIAQLNLFGSRVQGAKLSADFDVSRAEAAGDLMIEVQSLTLSQLWLARFERFLTSPDSAADWVGGFDELTLKGRASLLSKDGGIGANLSEVFRITNPDERVNLALSGGRTRSTDFFLGLSEGWSLDMDLLVRQSGVQLPVMDLELDAMLAPDTTGQSFVGFTVRRLAGDFDSLRFSNLRIGGQGIEVSGKGSLRDFSGTAKGGLLINGQIGESFGFENSIAQLDGSFQLSFPGRVLYTHKLGACAFLESRNFRLIQLYLPNSKLEFCPSQDKPIMDLKLGDGDASQMVLFASVTGRDVLITDLDRFNLEGEMPQFDLSTNFDVEQGNWSMTYKLDGGSMVFGDQVSLLDELKLSGIADGTSEGINNVEIDMERMRVSSAGNVVLFAPFLIDGQMRTQNRIGSLEGDLFDIRGRQMGGYTGEHDWRTQGGFLTFDTDTLLLKPGGFQPQVLFPVFADMMADARGALRATGVIDWKDGSIKSNGNVELIDIDFASLVGPVSGVNSQIQLGSLLPLATLTPQRIDIQQIDVGIDLFFGEFLFSLTADGDVVLEEAVWPWAGGEIGFDRAALIFDETPQDLNLFVRAVDLAEVFALLDVDGLTGTGVLQGKLPVRIEGGGITILDGVLTSSEDGGILSYQGAVSVSADEDDGSKLMFDALENFTYERLQVSISGRTTDDLKVAILLEGSNPQVLNGYPFKINISTEGPLAEMVRQGTIGYRVPERIRDQLQ